MCSHQDYIILRSYVVLRLRTTMWLWFALDGLLVFSNFSHSFELPRLLGVNCFCRWLCHRLVQIWAWTSLSKRLKVGRIFRKLCLKVLHLNVSLLLRLIALQIASSNYVMWSWHSWERSEWNWAGVQITKKTLERCCDALAKKLFALKRRPLIST